MSLPLIFHPAAERELNDAAEYYELENSALRNQFLLEVKRTTVQVLETPLAGPLVRRTVRRRLVRRFPYAAYYVIHAVAIRILAVAHLKRRPFYWKDRA